jgi:hypothetical protein
VFFYVLYSHALHNELYYLCSATQDFMPNMAAEVINGQIPDILLGGGDTAPKKPANKKLTVEKIYQKKSQLEHILLRPDTYIGKFLMFWLCD